MATILVIEDSATERHAMKETLQKAGYSVLEAVDGESGVKMAAESKPDLILMDIVMPGMNGFQATRAITRDEATKHIPVVMVTTKTQQTDQVWGERQGASAYLTKPLDMDALLTTIKAQLGN